MSSARDSVGQTLELPAIKWHSIRIFTSHRSLTDSDPFSSPSPKVTTECEVGISIVFPLKLLQIVEEIIRSSHMTNLSSEHLGAMNSVTWSLCDW